MLKIPFCFLQTLLSLPLLTTSQFAASLKHPLLDAKIVGGRDAEIEKFPFMVYILAEVEDYQIACGGSYIKILWILTAGHCLDTSFNQFDTKRPDVGKHDRIEAAMGLTKLSDRNTPLVQIRKSQKLFIHPKYREKLTELRGYDIGLIEIAQPFELSENVGFATLPVKNMKYDNMNCTVIGWGGTVPVHPPSPAQTLQMLRTTVWAQNYRVCFPEVHLHLLCTGKQNALSCIGDSGGPLLCEGVTVGVSSFGFGCNGGLSVYENVYMHTQWIDRVISREQHLGEVRNFNTNVRFSVLLLIIEMFTCIYLDEILDYKNIT